MHKRTANKQMNERTKDRRYECERNKKRMKFEVVRLYLVSLNVGRKTDANILLGALLEVFSNTERYVASTELIVCVVRQQFCAATATAMT